MNARQIWEETSKRIQKIYDIREANNIAYLLLEDHFGISKTDMIAGLDCEIHIAAWEEALSQLLSSKPVQYVTGKAYFYGRKYKIGPEVLIPRPETEELVDLIIRENQKDTLAILEVGVGSGCIAISLALALKGKIRGTDISPAAIQWARLNAANLNATIAFYPHDILTTPIKEKNLDILVSNPPYIPETERPLIQKNVLDFEPELALFVPSTSPLLFYEKIATEGLEALKKNGRLYFEIHEAYGHEVKILLEKTGYTRVIVRKDMQGKDRMISAERP